MNRLGVCLVYVFLTVITFGIYPVYYWVTRTEENLELQRAILAAVRDKK